jgi:hypothetical protein
MDIYNFHQGKLQQLSKCVWLDTSQPQKDSTRVLILNKNLAGQYSIIVINHPGIIIIQLNKGKQ